MTNELKTKNFRLKTPPTIMEVIDGEAIMINGEKGTYYNLSSQATLIFQSILDGCNLEEICFLNNLEPETGQHIETIIDKLINEDVLEEIDKVNNTTSPNTLMINNFQKDIVLTIYDDMQDMLALDPIHEADEMVGWPEKK